MTFYSSLLICCLISSNSFFLFVFLNQCMTFSILLTSSLLILIASDFSACIDSSYPPLMLKLYALLSNSFLFQPVVFLCIVLTVYAFFRIKSLRRALERFRQNHPSTTVAFRRSIKLTSSPEIALWRRSHHYIKRGHGTCTQQIKSYSWAICCLAYSEEKLELNLIFHSISRFLYSLRKSRDPSLQRKWSVGNVLFSWKLRMKEKRLVPNYPRKPNET